MDQFCAVEPIEDLDKRIQAAERMVAAATNAATLNATREFEKIELKTFDSSSLGALLSKDLPSLEAEAAKHVQNHIATHGPSAEGWIASGISLRKSQPSDSKACPFCAQDLADSPVIKHYQAYFSQSYTDLKKSIADAVQENLRLHGGDTDAAFERSISKLKEAGKFWSEYCEVPSEIVDSLEIARKRRAVREVVSTQLARKQNSPLEKIALSQESMSAINDFNAESAAVLQMNERFQSANAAIELIKEQSAAGNLDLLKTDLTKLNAVKIRFSEEIVRACDDYLSEKSAKADTEKLRDQARTDLNLYQTTVFPAYNELINEYLVKFSAGFRLRGMSSTNTRAGATCVYKLEVGESSVTVGSAAIAPGEPSFKTMLSAGDRSTLALAFFFVSLDRSPNLGTSIVIIDDPMTSLDEHRTTATAQGVRALMDRCTQLVVLSHNKPFLCRVWKRAGDSKAGMQIVRSGNGSVFESWNVNEDSFTNHDKRDKLMRSFVTNGASNPRPTAEAIRPHLEGYLRVVKAQHFKPGAMLGEFLRDCRDSKNRGVQILDSARYEELDQLNEYGTRFHHENPAWQTEVINAQELLSYVKRTLEFSDR